MVVRCMATLDVNFVICVVGAVLSFAPLMIGVNDCRENREILYSLRSSRFYRDASLATFMITIPSAVDAIIDVVQTFVAYASKKILQPTVLTSVKHISAKTTAVRLSPMERLAFTVGVASLCAFSLSPPVDKEFDGVSLALYYSVTNFNTICTMCPLVFFLKRCTKLWTPFRSFLVIFLINFGSVVSAVSYSFPINSPSYFILCMTAATCIGSATFIMITICWIFIRQFMTSNYRIKKSDFASESWGSFICQTMRQSKKYGKFYNNYVPVMHTIALLTFSVSNVAWYFILTDLVYITTMFTILQFIAAIILFVVEIRIRQSEVQRGLDLLDSKRSFVRYISHEIRTPLSTVMMGLDLLASDLDDHTSMPIGAPMRRPLSITRRKGENPVQTEDRHCETILLIQESCKLAVEICDDLLNHEKFEDDDMSLVVTTVPAAKLFHEIVQPFTVQARRNGVSLYCDILDPELFDADSIPLGAILEDGTGNPHLMKLYTLPSSPTASGRQSRYGSGSGSGTAGGSETLLSALVDVDRRRIAHVLRNLLSNALNFTPSGGDVTVSVRLSSRMGPKVPGYPRPYLQSLKGGLSLSRNISRSSSSVFGSRSSPNDDPTTVVNTLSNSERGVSIHTDILSFKNCDIGVDFVPKPDDSPDLLSDRPDCLDFNSASISPRRTEGMRPAPTRSSSANNNCNRHRKTLSGSETPHSPMRGNGSTPTNTRSRWSLWPSKLVKGSVHGKPCGRIRKKSPCYLIVEVTDTGTGIARENLDRIFKEIVQFNPNELHGGGHGGSGLGMVLSKGIVEAHGGKMWLTSEGLGKGSTFGFGLPLSKSSTHPEHRGRQDTSTPIIRTTHGSGSVGDSIIGSASVDAQTRSFHSSVVAALSELDVVPRPYGIPGIPDSTTPPRTILRQSSLSTIRNDIMKVASFKDPILEGSARTGEIVLKRGTHDRYHPPDPLQTAFVTLSPTPEDNRMAHDDSDLTPIPLRDSMTFGLHQTQDSITTSSVADYIPQTDYDIKDIPTLPRPFQRDSIMRRRSHSAETSKTEPRLRTLHSMKPRHALIVEDSPVCRRMLGKVLQSLSITYEEAEDGLQAVDKMQLSLHGSSSSTPSMTPTHHTIKSDRDRDKDKDKDKDMDKYRERKLFDLILCDNIMPNMCGPEAVKAIREMGFLGPIFGVTGNMLAKDVEDFINHGADVILGKPLKISILCSAIREHFNDNIIRS